MCPHRWIQGSKLRSALAVLIVGLVAQTALAQEVPAQPAPAPEASAKETPAPGAAAPKVTGKISVERAPERKSKPKAAEPGSELDADAETSAENLIDPSNPHEARVGDRIKIQLTDVTGVDWNAKVVVKFTNKERFHEVNWARWEDQAEEQKDGKAAQGAGGEDLSKRTERTLVVSVPQRVLPESYKSEWVSVEVTIGDKTLPSRAGFHVFPKTRVVLETINGRRVKSEPPAAVEWTHQVRVTGAGFLAPAKRIDFRIDGIRFEVQSVDPDGMSFVAQLKEDSTDSKAGLSHLGKRPLSLSVWDKRADQAGFDTVQVEDGTQLTTERKWAAVAIALVPLAILAALLGLACSRLGANRAYDVLKSTGGAAATAAKPHRLRRFGAFEVLLLDPATNTYSLSRFQFIWWLGIVLFSYSYLFVARGKYVAQDWCFYDLSGSAYPLLISLGTLVAATWTTKIVGPKGSGAVHPSLTDLFVHGGVISLDRVQQLAISVIAGAMFVWIAWRTAPTSATLPDVPERLLTLMGCSSAGYLGGKFARKPGPIVGLVDVSYADGSKTGVIRVWGSNLSVGAGVFVNQKRLKPDVVSFGDQSDGETGFTNVLRIAEEALPVPLADIVSIVVVNGDSQEARWSPPEGTTGIPVG